MLASPRKNNNGVYSVPIPSSIRHKTAPPTFIETTFLRQEVEDQLQSALLQIHKSSAHLPTRQGCTFALHVEAHEEEEGRARRHDASQVRPTFCGYHSLVFCPYVGRCCCFGVGDWWADDLPLVSFLWNAAELRKAAGWVGFRALPPIKQIRLVVPFLLFGQLPAVSCGLSWYTPLLSDAPRGWNSYRCKCEL